MKHSLKQLGSFLALGGMLLSTACIFDTRDANPPSNSGGGCVLDRPQQPFVCMANALAKRQNGDYERSISQNFVFTPTPADLNDQDFDGLCIYDNWTKAVEMETINLLISGSAAIDFDYGTLTPKINENTFVQFEVNYTLTVVRAPADTLVYRAIADLAVRNESGNWRVTKWNETTTIDQFTTWGNLRGELRKSQGGSFCVP